MDKEHRDEFDRQLTLPFDSELTEFERKREHARRIAFAQGAMGHGLVEAMRMPTR